MLNRHEVVVAREESERVDTLRYTWERLQALASESQGELIKIQPNFKSDLLESVEAFIIDVDYFSSDYLKVSIQGFGHFCSENVCVLQEMNEPKTNLLN